MNSHIKKYVGIVLRNTRKSKLYTVEDVVKHTNLNKDTIYRYEQGKASDLKTLGILLDFYDVPFNIFFKQCYDICHTEN